MACDDDDDPPCEADAVQLDLWEDLANMLDTARRPLPHPSTGTHWQRVLTCYPRNVPLIYGRPER